MIFNVGGGGGGNPNLETKTKTYTPSESQQTEQITASSGYDGLQEVDVTVNAISSTYVGSGVTKKNYTIYYPSSSNQTISSGQYLNGDQVFKAVTTTALIDSNIRYGATVKVGDNDDDDRITSVTGSYTYQGGISYGQSPVTASQMLSGYSGYMNGAEVKGNIETKTSSDLTASGATVTAPAGYYASSASKTITTGTATAPTSISGTSAGLSYGTNTITLAKNVSVTPRITTAGYISSGTAGTSTVSLTADVTTKAAETFHPSSSDQTINGQIFLTGSQTFKGVTTTNLTAANIKDGVTVEIGDSTDGDCVTSVTGTYSGSKYKVTLTNSGNQYQTYLQLYGSSTKYYTSGDIIDFDIGDRLYITCGYGNDNEIRINNSSVVYKYNGSATYTYYLPPCDVSVSFSLSAGMSIIYITVPELSINSNGNIDLLQEYGRVTTNVPTITGRKAEKLINFIDYDGEIIESYTNDEWSNVSSLPSNPSHAGLISQGWNWTKASIDSYLTNTPGHPIYIGQMYKTSSGDTELDIIISQGRHSPILSIAVSGTVEIDWGDNSTADSVTGTSLSTSQFISHTYSSDGEYTIKISVTSGSFRFYCSSSYLLFRVDTTSTSVNSSRVYSNILKRVRFGDGVTSIGNYAFRYCACLESITIPSTITTINSDAFAYCYSLKCFIMPTGTSSIGANAFSYCYALSHVALKTAATLGSNTFDNCFSLVGTTSTTMATYLYRNCHAFRNPILGSGTIPGNIFYGCESITCITIPSGVTAINSSAFYNCFGVAEYHIKPTSPPTLGSSVFYGIPTDCKIYVPTASLSTYQTTSGWSDYASQMVGE